MQGRIRAIGVCSSLPAHLKAFSDVSDVVPAVNQFEISPLNTQKELIRYCQDRGIAVEGMSTFSHFRDTKTRREIVDNERIAPIAQHHGKTIPQVILRWLVQQGISIIPKSSNKDRLAQNISIFDFSLSPEEMAVLDSLDQGHFLNYKPDLTLTAAYALWGRFPEKYRTTGWD
jgi:diketogulonate reductase-like aldo/keto reductase